MATSSIGRAPVETVTTSDGRVIAIEKRRPAGAPRGLVVLTHAMMVDRRSLDRPPGRGFASAWVEAGWETWLVDFRGHGSAVPTAADGAVWSYSDLVERDVPALFAAARAARPDRRLVYCGHSLGGHVGVAGAALSTDKPDAFVLWSTNLWLPSLEPSWVRRRLKGLAIRSMDRLTRRVGRFPSRALRIGPADEAEPYVRDLAEMWRTDRWAWRQHVASLDVPMLSVIGRGDRLLAHPDGAAGWASLLGSQGAEFWLVGRGSYGLASDPDHMGLVTDLGSAGVWRAAIGWAEAAVEPL